VLPRIAPAAAVTPLAGLSTRLALASHWQLQNRLLSLVIQFDITNCDIKGCVWQMMEKPPEPPKGRTGLITKRQRKRLMKGNHA
jgi:hypothetical protein